MFVFISWKKQAKMLVFVSWLVSFGVYIHRYNISVTYENIYLRVNQKKNQSSTKECHANVV